MVAFLALLLLAILSPAPACAVLAHSWDFPGGFVPVLQLIVLSALGGGSHLSQEASTEGQAALLDVGNGFILLVLLLARCCQPEPGCSELSEGKGWLGGCRGPPARVLSGLAAANPPLPQQGQRRGPVRSHGMKKRRWRDQVSAR